MDKDTVVFEVCVGNFNEGVEAFKKGASRIEICDNLKEDGTTQSYGTVRALIEAVDIPVMAIIRPRGGDFTYTKKEVEIMKMDIEIFKTLDISGFVIGAIRDGFIDEVVIEELIEVIKGSERNFEITYHMAFDEIKKIEDKKRAIDKLVDFKIDRILTKGGEGSALDNLDDLKELVDYAKDRIIIMPGKGITRENRDEVLKKTRAKEFHGSRII